MDPVTWKLQACSKRSESWAHLVPRQSIPDRYTDFQEFDGMLVFQNARGQASDHQ